MANNKPTTGAQKGERLAFNNTVTQQGNSQKISGSIRDLKKNIAQAKTPVQRLNPSGKTMGQIADEVAQNIKTHTPQGVLGNSHMGGHSDVMGAVNLGGFTVKTPIIKPSSTKNK
jgi:hypothetical protein